MDSSEQRRKRKRIAKSLPSHSHFLTVRSLFLCFGFLGFLYLLSDQIPIIPSVFRPVLVVPSLSSSNYSIKEYSENLFSPLKLKIEDRILLPDHVLLIVLESNLLLKKSEKLECNYFKSSLNNDTSIGIDGEIVSVKIDALSVDKYDEFRLIVRCPLPPVNYSPVVSLQRKGQNTVNLSNGTVHGWENLAYAATLDGDSAVVFVKGLNLRADRESDASQFSCHFGMGDLERDGKFALTTKAITAAQEVIRCSLPKSIENNPNKAQGIRVTIGVSPHVHARAHEHFLVPSVAKVFDSQSEIKKRSGGKYELCACTMVWNQASSLREWISYHSWLGVGRWFIYDNNSDDNIKEVIEELELEDYNVTRHVWPWVKTQEAGFSHCTLRAKDECNWVGFMDVDEFFYFPVPNPGHQRFRKLGFPGQNSLKTLVSNFTSSTTIAEIRTACHSFGPSGLNSPPRQGVTVGYTCRLQSPERHKSIIRPDALDVTLLNVVHHFHLKKGFTYLNLPQSTAVINHYKYQVWEAFRAKFFRRVATYVADWQENQNEGSRDRAPGLGTEAIEPLNWRRQFCEVWDTGLRDFVLANLADPSNGLLPWERYTQ